MKRQILAYMATVAILAVIFLFGFFTGRKTIAKVVHVDLDADKKTEVEEPGKYPFLNSQLSRYICNLSEELGIDSDLVVAILMNENPEFNPDVIHRNENGTNDLGLFQLNDRYCYTTFVESYWDMDVEFNPYNWKHNTFIALHHIEYLQSRLKVQDDVIMAYNGGIGAVINNQIASSTYYYLARVKNNLRLLKG